MESPKEKPRHDSNVEWTDKDEEMGDDKDTSRKALIDGMQFCGAPATRWEMRRRRCRRGEAPHRSIANGRCISSRAHTACK
jgi:hypothetical protein